MLIKHSIKNNIFETAERLIQLVWSDDFDFLIYTTKITVVAWYQNGMNSK